MLFKNLGAFLSFCVCEWFCREEACLACDGTSTHTHFTCSHNEENADSMSSGQTVVLMVLQVIKLRLIR